tara:strand:- start:25 stop:378 length:354 start_codon:yes stop_codon:yes gene_type:complete
MNDKYSIIINPLDTFVMCSYNFGTNYVHVLTGDNMDAISYTSARANLASTMEKVCNDHSPIIITRKSENPVVMMSLEDYQAMEETTYLLRSPANARQLLESIAELEAGNGVERALIE